jgi:GTP-binding protein
LINALLNRKALARTSGQTGKTQTINIYNVNHEMYIVDLPGYGYAKVSKEVSAKWGPMIENYLHSSYQLRMVFLLIDIRHKPTANDIQMYRWILSNGFSPVIICTKMDKLKKTQVKKHLDLITSTLKVIEGVPVIPFSAVTKQGRDEIWDLIETYALGEEMEIPEE